MIVPDLNLLLYAYDSAAPKHDSAGRWLKSVIAGDELIGISWQTISGFLRISTNVRLAGQRYSTEEAVGIVQQWIDLKMVRILTPGKDSWSFFQRMMVQGDVRGPVTSDAELAALTIEYGGTLYTTDRDFARFPGLRWINPLTTQS